MSTLLVPWLLYPFVLLVLVAGCGLLVEAAAGRRLPGPLVLPSGLAGLVAVSLLATMSIATARLAAPAVIAVAVAGLLLAIGKPRRSIDWWAIAAAAGVFVVYAAPVVLSGEATFPGYVKLDDDATFLANLDRIMEHGRSLDGLEPSSYLATLQPHLAKGYPLGAVMPVGVGRKLVGGDSLWLYHPAVALTAAMLALALYALAASVVSQRWLCAFAAFAGAQSALLYGYALWGGLKEVAGAAAVALASALVWPTVRGRPSGRAFLPLAVASAWLLGVLSSGAVIWLLPAVGTAAVATLRSGGRRSGGRAVAVFAGLVIALSLPTLVAAPSFLANRIFEFDFLGNLVRRLEPAQLAGIWPTGDFRFRPEQSGVTYALVGIACVAAAAGIVWALRRREWAVPVYACGVLASVLTFAPFVTPWIEAKTFAMAAPAIPFAALVASSPLVAAGRRVEGIVLAAVVSGGVLWSNALAYHDVWLAPRGQLAELEVIGKRAGQGPALMTEFQPYGVRHLLRKLDAEGASELRIRAIPLRDGRLLAKGETIDIDELDQSALRIYRTLVLRRSPLDSRPPSGYRLVSSGRWYDVWQRHATAFSVLEHLPLGNGIQPSAVPDCAEVDRLARLAGRRGRLAAVERAPAIVAGLAGYGTDRVTVNVETPGRYGVWIGGSIRNNLTASVDDASLPAVGHHLDHDGYYTRLGEVVLPAGVHTVELSYTRGRLRPGSGGTEFPIGPLVLSETARASVVTVTAANARSLCGKPLDWIEATRR